MSVSMTIRDVPDETRDELAARAARAGMSLQEYLRAQLVGLASQPDPAEFWDRVRARVSHREPTFGPGDPGRQRRRPRMTLVVDSSVVVAGLIDDGPDGE